MGLLMIIVMVVLLIKFKWYPVVVFTTLPIIVSLLLGNGVMGTAELIAPGITKVLPVAALFIGSITYFGIMSDVGLFDGLVNWLTRRIKNNIVVVFLVTALIALVAHLDGSGTTTYLIVVPAMLPIAEKLKIRKLPMAFCAGIMVAVMNNLPWGGPMARGAIVSGLNDPVALWKLFLPIQIFGVILAFVTCILIAKEEIHRGYYVPDPNITFGDRSLSDEQQVLKRPKLVWFNLILTVAVLALLFKGVSSYIPFILGTGIALQVNYGREGKAFLAGRIKAHAGNVLPMVFTMICAGILLGIVSGTGMITAMAEIIVAFIPPSLGKILHIVMGILAIPLSIVFDSDTLFYGILPVVIDVGSQYGVPATKAALAMCLGNNVGVGMSMVTAAVYFSLGLWNIEYEDSLKYNFFRRLIFGVVLLLFGFIIGVL